MGTVSHKNAPSHSGLSQSLWGNFPFQNTQRTVGSGGGPMARFIMEDYMGFGKSTAVSSNLGRYASRAGCYQSWEDTGGSIANLPTLTGGGIRLTNDTTDNDEVNMQLGDITGVLGALSVTAGKAGCVPTWYETRVRFPTQVASGDCFVGLAEEGVGVTDFFGDSDTFADKDYIGFYTVAGAPTTLKFAYHKAGGTEVSFTAATIAVDTWYKLGFLFIPPGFSGYGYQYDANKLIRVFVDNAEYTTSYITKTQGDSTTHFPGDEEMSPMMSVKNSTTVARAMDSSFWAWGQLIQ